MSWTISFSEPLKFSFHMNESDNFPSKESILSYVDNSEMSKYNKMNVRRCLINLTGNIVQSNICSFINCVHPVFGDILITISKKK